MDHCSRLHFLSSSLPRFLSFFVFFIFFVHGSHLYSLHAAPKKVRKGKDRAHVHSLTYRVSLLRDDRFDSGSKANCASWESSGTHGAWTRTHCIRVSRQANAS